MEFNVYLILSCAVLLFVVHVFGCDDSNCIASNGTVCNGQGVCDCGVCKCEGQYSGLTCEECPTCPSPCDTYKDCVSCKVFGTGPLGAMKCIIYCDKIATFFPVEKSEFDDTTSDEGKMLCRNLNNANCMESFRIGGMRDGFRDLFVRTEEDCSVKYIPTNPPVIEEVPTDNTKDEGSESNREPDDHGKRIPEDVSAVSGSNQSQTVDDNGAAIQTLSSILILTVTLLYFLL